MARDPARAAARERLARTSAPQKEPSRPSRLRIWMKRRRSLLRPAIYGALGCGALAVAALAVRAIDPAGRVRGVAEAFGGVYKGRKTGTLSHLAGCSFCQNKTFTTGGAICGYCSTGIILSAMAPSRVMTSAITIAKRGRLMKNVSMMAP